MSAALVYLGACQNDDVGSSDSTPAVEPSVTGTVGLGTEFPNAPFLSEASDDYFLGMSLADAATVVAAGRSGSLDAGDLRSGDRVEVWVTGPCAESFPVQCTVQAVHILD